MLAIMPLTPTKPDPRNDHPISDASDLAIREAKTSNHDKISPPKQEPVFANPAENSKATPANPDKTEPFTAQEREQANRERTP